MIEMKKREEAASESKDVCEHLTPDVADFHFSEPFYHKCTG